VQTWVSVSFRQNEVETPLVDLALFMEKPIQAGKGDLVVFIVRLHPGRSGQIHNGGQICSLPQEEFQLIAGLSTMKGGKIRALEVGIHTTAVC
jgi:hypothetical protein